MKKFLQPPDRARKDRLQDILDNGGWIYGNKLYAKNDKHITNVSSYFMRGMDITYCPVNYVYLSKTKYDEVLAQRQLTSMIKGERSDVLFKPARDAERDRNQVFTPQYRGKGY